MTVTNAKQTLPVRRPLHLGVLVAGLAAGLYAAGSSALPVTVVAAGMGQAATGALADPAKRSTGFSITILASAALLILSVIGVVMALMTVTAA